MFIFPHGATVDRDGNLWVTDARGDERQGPPGLQVQSRRQGADDARQGRRQRLGARSLRSADRRRGRAERRHLRHRQPPQRQEQPRGEVHEGRQVHQGVGQEGIRAAARSASRTPSRWIRAGGCSSAIARTTASRSSIRTARISTSGGSSAGRAASPSRGTTRSTWPIRSRVPIPARTSSPASRKASASAARATERVTAFIEDMESTTRGSFGAEGVGVDAQGNVYGAVVRRQMLERHVKK